MEELFVKGLSSIVNAYNIEYYNRHISYKRINKIIILECPDSTTVSTDIFEYLAKAAKLGIINGIKVAYGKDNASAIIYTVELNTIKYLDDNVDKDQNSNVPVVG